MAGTRCRPGAVGGGGGGWDGIDGRRKCTDSKVKASTSDRSLHAAVVGVCVDRRDITVVERKGGCT